MKEGYKDTEIGVIPVEWEVAYTGNVVNVGAGNGFKVDYQGCLDKPTPFYKVSDMNSLGNEVFMDIANNWYFNVCRFIFFKQKASSS